jgi:Holliday junction DNA helicase RuvA
VKEDSVSLYGFLTESERRVFRDVQKVTGIGAKIALAILSRRQRRRVRAPGADQRRHRAHPHPGIGKKTAERIVVELRDRAAASVAAPPRSGRPRVPADPATEAGIALAQLGYKQAEIGACSGGGPGRQREDIIRKALKTC